MAQTPRSELRRIALVSGVVAACLVLSACETRVANRGHSPDIEDIAAIQPGTDVIYGLRSNGDGTGNGGLLQYL